MYHVQNDLLGGGRSVSLSRNFGYSAYPRVVNAATGNLERGGACSDRVAAMLGVETYRRAPGKARR
jgi:hypothetical protein